MTSPAWPTWIRSGEWRGSGDRTIPILPALAHRAITVALDPNVTIAQLSLVVSKDPALATRVMHLSNAAYCAPLQQVTTLTEAIVRMGTAATRNLVIVACLSSRGFEARVYGPEGRRQFDHAVGTAYMAHLVAELARTDPDEAFLSGLLHDIGKLLLLKLARDYTRWFNIPVSAEELDDVLVSEHSMLGALLLRELQLPRCLIERVMWHHEPQSATQPLDAEVTYLADRLSHRYAFGCDRDEKPIVGDLRCVRIVPTEIWLESVDGRAPGLYEVARQVLN
jgi:putative nucleotidyltransferase with HDIG domain